MITSRIEGGILDVTPAGIVGWARDGLRPLNPVHVILSIGGQPVASTVADRFDIPEVRSLLGPTTPGFIVYLQEQSPQAPPFEVIARSANGHYLGSPFLIRTKEQIQGVIRQFEQTEYEGLVESLRDGRLVGWVWDRLNTAEALCVAVFDGPWRLGHTIANIDRDDLRAAGKRDGKCGFTFELPNSLLDFRPHQIRLLVGQNYEIPNSPIIFGPSSASKLIEEILELRIRVEHLTVVIEELRGTKSVSEKVVEFEKNLMPGRLSALTKNMPLIESDMRHRSELTEGFQTKTTGS